jgi:hypothetical protein
MLFVVCATDKTDILPTRPNSIAPRSAGSHDVDVVTASALGADDGRFLSAAYSYRRKERAAVDSFTRNDPYHLNSVSGNVQIHRYNKKRGLPITSRGTD